MGSPGSDKENAGFVLGCQHVWSPSCLACCVQDHLPDTHLRGVVRVLLGRCDLWKQSSICLSEADQKEGINGTRLGMSSNGMRGAEELGRYVLQPLIVPGAYEADGSCI